MVLIDEPLADGLFLVGPGIAGVAGGGAGREAVEFICIPCEGLVFLVA